MLVSPIWIFNSKKIGLSSFWTSANILKASEADAVTPPYLLFFRQILGWERETIQLNVI